MAYIKPRKNIALLVDPDAESSAAIRASIVGLPLEFVAVGTVSAAMRKINDCAPRLVLSELALPDGSGFGLCRLIRENPDAAGIPVVLLSKWAQEADRILAFECGADDFVAKPFFSRELSSRISAVLRRLERSNELSGPSLAPSNGPVVIDEERREIRIDGIRIDLTPREFSLFATLVNHRGRVVSRRELILQSWTDGESPTERSVDAHVKSLRRKLAGAKHAIETVRGLGYRFSEIRLKRE